MTLREALVRLGFENTVVDFPPETADAEFLENSDDLSFAEQDVRDNATYCSIPADIADKMAVAAAIARNEPAVAVIARLIFRIVFLSSQDSPVRWAWQPLDQYLKDNAGPMYLLIAAGWAPVMRKMHKEISIPEEVTRATCYQLRAYCDNHITGTGKCGIYPNQLSWMHYYFNPEQPFIRLGRFEFRWLLHYTDCHVYRNKATGKLVIFAIPGLQFDVNGFAVENRPDSPERAFTSFFEKDEEKGIVSGNTVDEFGCTSKEATVLNVSEYDLMIGRGMPVLEMHIPNGGGMTSDEAEKSFRYAKNFFRELYANRPERIPVAIVCSSWIFNPNLPEILSPESNLVRLLKRVHPVPRSSSRTDGLWFIFRHEGAFDLLKVPRKTSLQRAVTDFIAKGGRWRVGGMFLLMDEIH